MRGILSPSDLEGADAVVHLAGESLAHRWSSARKRAIRESRVRGTELVARTLAAVERKPRVLLSASAIGIYGDRGDEPLDEESVLGSDFLAGVAREWEAGHGRGRRRGSARRPASHRNRAQPERWRAGATAAPLPAWE